MYALALAGAAGSPPLCRCDLRAKLLVTNHLSSMWGYPVLYLVMCCGCVSW